MTHVTTDMEEEPLARIAFNLGVQDPGMLSGEELYQESVYMVFLNGTILGVVRNHARLVRIFRMLRRKCLISSFVSIYPQHKFRCVHISSDNGRLCRPYIIVENGQLLLKKGHMKLLEQGLRTFEDFLHEGNFLVVFNFFDIQYQQIFYKNIFSQV